MLLGVTHDRKFQLYIGRQEERLYQSIRPPMAAAIRIQATRGTHAAQAYLIKRGELILFAHYKRVYRDAYDSIPFHFGKQARTGVGAFLQRQLAWLRSEAGTRIHGISQNLVNDVGDVLMEGVREGKDNRRIGEELEARIPELTQTRAATIARTETHSSALDAIDEVIREREIAVVSKTWWTAADGRVRPSHEVMHGETVDMDEPFELEGGELMYPGDDSLGADEGELINCRCSVLYNT